MKKYLLHLALITTTINAADNITAWFSEGKINGNLRYYYIETNKKSPTVDSSAHANSFGGNLHYETSKLNGFSSGITFMSTNAFRLPDKVDASLLARDNGVRLENSAGGSEAQKSFSVIGEAYLEHFKDGLKIGYGRKAMNTPLLHTKDVRMILSTVQGAYAKYIFNDNTTFSINYLTHFKQRTSNKFTNIVEHVLGSQTKAITGDDKQDLILFGTEYAKDSLRAKFYDYYATNFINMLYTDLSYSSNLNNGSNWSLAAQFISQYSIQNSDENLAKTGSITGGKQISSNALALKGSYSLAESTFTLAASKLFSDSNKHDSLVLPWDGTPLFTNMITANNLFQSNYGKGLQADSVYIGGSKALKIGFSQKFGFADLKGLKASLSYLITDNDRFMKKQKDLNAVLSYSKDNYSVAFKGIWVDNNSDMKANGTVTQIDDFSQFRVIANYNW